MLFATEKDQKLALISFEYARKRKEIEGTQDQEELLKQLNRQEQLEKFLGSWTGHIKTSDSANLKFYIKKEYELWNNKQLA